MGNRLRARLLERIDQVSQAWRRFVGNHPRFIHTLIKAYITLTWAALFLAIICWIFIPASRVMLVQLLWSYYALWQFWFLSRSKTLGWSHTARFFVIGAWVTAPLSALIVWSVHSLGEGEAETTLHDEWSSAVFGPFVEETVKLLPLLLLLFLSRRVRSFSLTDFLLVGAATGTGFDFLEEVVRTWVTQQQASGLFGFLFQAFNTSELVWEIDTLFPGYFRNGEVISAGHHVWTAFVALGIGMAHRLRRRWGRKAYLLPGFLFLWAVFDHGAYNASLNGLSPAVEFLYFLTGYGHFYKGAFTAALVVAVFWDYREINRVNDLLPRLPKEEVIEPVTEFLTLCRAILKGRQEWGHALLFLRERRQRSFALLNGDKTAIPKEATDVLIRRRAILSAALGCLLMVAVGAWLNAFPLSSDSAYFAGLIDDLAKWWEGLDWYEKAAVLLTALLIGALFTVATGGGWIAAGFTGLSAALTLEEVLSNPRPVTAFLRNPIGFLRSWWRELRKLPPQQAAVAVTALLAEQAIERIPAVKVLDRLADRLKDAAQRVAKRLWRQDTADVLGGRRMDFATDDSLRHPTGEKQKGTGKTAHSPDGSPPKDSRDKPSPDQKPDDSYPPRTESGRIDWVKQRLLPVEERIDRLLESGRFKADPERLAEMKTKVLEEQRSSLGSGGYNGELEFIERKVFEEKKVVEMIQERKGAKNPDYLVDGDITEVKTIVETKDKPGKLSSPIREANDQIKKSGLIEKKTLDGTPVGSVEIQLNQEGANSFKNVSVDELRRSILNQFHEYRSRSLHRVAVYREHQLIIELIRTTENKIIQRFPKR